MSKVLQNSLLWAQGIILMMLSMGLFALNHQSTMDASDVEEMKEIAVLMHVSDLHLLLTNINLVNGN
jgi:uncharacterized membrane protein SirB2